MSSQWQVKSETWEVDAVERRILSEQMRDNRCWQPTLTQSKNVVRRRNFSTAAAAKGQLLGIGRQPDFTTAESYNH